MTLNMQFAHTCPCIYVCRSNDSLYKCWTTYIESFKADMQPDTAVPIDDVDSSCAFCLCRARLPLSRSTETFCPADVADETPATV